jgi:DNA repair exonuclease SbcCD ATPase subunit
VRITACHVRNYKRVREIAIQPDADAALVLIGGKNAQGKSSVLDALTAAFGGKRLIAGDPVRHGAEQAEIDVVLDDGELSIRRVIQPDGESTLELRDRSGKVSSPQARLDRIVANRFLDPLAFLALAATEQRAQLLAMFDRDGAIAKLEERRERIYAKRTEVGRDLKKAAGELARLKEVEVGTPIDVSKLSAERQQITDKTRELQFAKNDQERFQQTFDSSERAVAEAELELARAKERLERALEARERCGARLTEATDRVAQLAGDLSTGQIERLKEINSELARAGEHNRAVFEAEASNKRRAAAAATVDQLEEQTAQQTELLAKLDAQKLEILASVGLPVEDLGISSDGLTLGDVPFAQASAAERLRVALALAMAASPNLDDIWIRDGALLDDDSLQLLAEHAEKAGKRCWVERVGDRDPGAIVIQDGSERPEAQRAAS